MLIDDAVVMLTKSFMSYSHSRETKESSESCSVTVKSVPAGGSSSLPAPKAPSIPTAIPSLGVVAEHLRPDAATRRLIGLLSADCELTNGELEHIISYLKFRQTALVSGRDPLPDSSSGPSAQLGYGSTRTADDNSQFVNSLMLEVAKLAGRP